MRGQLAASNTRDDTGSAVVDQSQISVLENRNRLDRQMCVSQHFRVS